MAEEIQLTNPEDPPIPGATRYRVARLSLDMGIGPAIVGGVNELDELFASVAVVLIGDNGALRNMILWSGAEARQAIQQLNTANLSAGNSLNRRIMARVQAIDSAMAGTISDVP